MKGFAAPVVLLICFFSFTPASYAAQTIQSLSTHPQWLKLGHYVANHYSQGWHSQVDEGHFFLSEQGKFNPLEELSVTLSHFQQEQKTSNYHTSCRYPARFQWLKQQLQTNWNTPYCPELKQWQERIQPERLTLIFPTAFINNPSSAFGHTLLRVDSKGQTKDRELVAFAINFAAQPAPGDNAFLYAFKGLVGSYFGAYALMPYHVKVREYNDLESRDIWEYPLNLSQEEVLFTLYHLWELQDAKFDYYFLDENCSYQLLALLQVARQDLNLIQAFPLHAIPSDTVSQLAQQGLISEPTYRAAFGTRLLHFSSQLEPQALQDAIDLTNFAPMPDDLSAKEQVQRLEMAYEILNFRFYDQRLNRDETVPQLRNLLMERSQHQIPSPFTAPLKPNHSPEQGHGSMRIGSGIALEGSDKYLSLDWRGSYHDQLDHPGGFVPGTQISFLDTKIGITRKGKLSLLHFHLLEAMSLAPVNAIFNSWSWNVRIGSDRQPGFNNWNNRWYSQGGYGKSWGHPNSVHYYLLGSAEVTSTPGLNSDASIGLGLEAGLTLTQNNQDKWLVSGHYLQHSDRTLKYRSELGVTWNKVLAKNWAIRSEIGYKQWLAEEHHFTLSLFHYF